jgi:dihydrolipoamide dehydrogenase
LPETIYDVAIIGSGPAGYTAAIRAGQYGLKTALIEKDGFLGGTCLHVGCIPTKALLFNAELWDHLKDAKEFGIEGVDARKLNWAAIQERKSKIVAKHAKGLEFLMKKNKVETVKGYGKLTGPAQSGILVVEVTNDGKTSQLRAKNVLLATGSEARMLPGLDADDRILTNIEILSLKEIPKSLVIVGAGASLNYTRQGLDRASPGGQGLCSCFSSSSRVWRSSAIPTEKFGSRLIFPGQMSVC